MSNQYGSYHYSLISTYEIYSPPEINPKIISLSEDDHKLIFNALLQIFPYGEYAPEITNIDYRIDTEIEINNIIELNSLNKINAGYISEQISKCKEKITNYDYDGAITNSRSLLESVLKYILEKYNISYENSWDLNKLYKETIKVLNMDPASVELQSFKQIASGCVNIVKGIAEIRNEFSDAHGKGKKRKIIPKARHVTLIVNISFALSEFLLQVFEVKTK